MIGCVDCLVVSVGEALHATCMEVTGLLWREGLKVDLWRGEAEELSSQMDLAASLGVSHVIVVKPASIGPDGRVFIRQLKHRGGGQHRTGRDEISYVRSRDDEKEEGIAKSEVGKELLKLLHMAKQGGSMLNHRTPQRWGKWELKGALTDPRESNVG